MVPALVVAGFLVRWALVLHKGTGFHFADTAEYDEAARAILHGHAPPASLPRAPLYPAFMAAVYALFGPGNFPAVRYVQLGVGAAIVALTGSLARRVAGARAGALAAFAAAFAPTLVYTSTMLYPNALYTMLLLLATIAAHALTGAPRVRAAVGFGAALALTWLTDQVGAIPALALLGWVIVCGRGTIRRRSAMLVVTLLTIAAIAAPWLVSRRASGPGVPIFLAKAQYVLQVARHDENLIGGHFVHDTTSWARWHPLPLGALLTREAGLLERHPAEYLHDVGFEFVHFFQPMPDRIQTANVYTGPAARWLVALYTVPMLLLGLAGLLFGGLALRDRVLLALVPFATAALYAFFFSQMRYRIPTEPEILALAAAGVVALWRRRASPLVRRGGDIRP